MIVLKFGDLKVTTRYPEMGREPPVKKNCFKGIKYVSNPRFQGTAVESEKTLFPLKQLHCFFDIKSKLTNGKIIILLFE